MSSRILIVNIKLLKICTEKNYREILIVVWEIMYYFKESVKCKSDFTWNSLAWQQYI